MSHTQNDDPQKCRQSLVQLSRRYASSTAASRLPHQVRSQTSLSSLHPHHLVAAVTAVTAVAAVSGGMIMVGGVRCVVHVVVHVCREVRRGQGVGGGRGWSASHRNPEAATRVV